MRLRAPEPPPAPGHLHRVVLAARPPGCRRRVPQLRARPHPRGRPRAPHPLVLRAHQFRLEGGDGGYLGLQTVGQPRPTAPRPHRHLLHLGRGRRRGRAAPGVRRRGHRLELPHLLPVGAPAGPTASGCGPTSPAGGRRRSPTSRPASPASSAASGCPSGVTGLGQLVGDVDRVLRRPRALRRPHPLPGRVRRPDGRRRDRRPSAGTATSTTATARRRASRRPRRRPPRDGRPVPRGVPACTAVPPEDRASVTPTRAWARRFVPPDGHHT